MYAVFNRHCGIGTVLATSPPHRDQYHEEKKWPEARSWCERRNLNAGAPEEGEA